ncbi:MAG: RnfABCDGE type electron transport complex subunit D [Eubacteriales bacterium]
MPDKFIISPAPHIRTPDTTRSLMLDVVIALLPAFAWGVYYFGTRALMLGIVSVASCVIFEALIELLLRRPVTIGDFSAVVTGLLLSMCLSSTVPLWMPVVGAFFAIVVVKQLFGGIGKNVVNPALAARVFLFAWPTEMGTFAAPGVRLSGIGGADAVASATPLVSLKSGAFPDATMFDLILGKTGGCIGEVSALLLAAGGVYLLIRRVITWQIPAAYLGTVALLTLLFPRVPAGNVSFMLSELFSGGLMLGAVFMATDYATSPVTPKGRLIYGAGCGLITVFIRYFGGYPEGVSFAILIMNLLVWYIDRFTMPVRFGGNSVEKKK